MDPNLIPILTALISGVAGGIIVALVNYWLARPKTSAEIEKLRAETRKIQAETSQLNGQVENLADSVSYQLAQVGEQVLYDGTKSVDLHDINVVEGRSWNAEVQRTSGPKAAGQVTVRDGNVLNIERTNTEGRLELWIDRYVYNGKVGPVIPANELITGYRKLRVSFESKVVDGTHELDVLLKDAKTGAVPVIKRLVVSHSEWTPYNLYFQVSPRLDLVVRIYDTRVTRAPSSLQIKNLMIAERTG